MNPDNADLSLYAPHTSTEDMLAGLAERQRVLILRLTTELDETKRTHNEAMVRFAAESAERKKVLTGIITGAKVYHDDCLAAVKQRDVILDALRSLCSHLANQPLTSLTYFGGQSFAKSYREAAELLKVIDTAQAAAAARPAE